MSYILDTYTYPHYCNSPWGIYKIDLFNATESIGDSSLEMERGNGEICRQWVGTGKEGVELIFNFAFK